VINLNIGGTLQIGNGGTAGKLLGGSGNLTNNGTLIFNHSNSLSYDGVLSGSGALGKQGTGALRITGANTYTGATTISGGILNLRSATGLGTTAGSTTVSNGATLQLAGAISVGAEALSLNGGAASGQTGALVNEGGKNTYGGAVTVTASSSISAATGSELSLTGGVVNNGTVATFNGGGTINVNTVAISGSSANSDLVIDGVTVNLGVSSTYNGSTFIRNSGTLNANVTNALPTAHGRTAVTFDGTGTAVLTLGAAQSVASLTSAGAATVTLGANTLRVGTSTGSTTFAGIIGGTGGLIKDDASTQTLSGANTYTGATTISAGILNLRNATGLGTTAGRTTVSNGATLQLQDGITVGAEGLSLNGGAASGQTGALVNVSGTNTYGGAVTVTASSSISAASGSVLNLTGGVVKNGTVATFNGGGTINVNTVAISGSSANSDLVIDGATVNLGVANTYNGPTVIRNGGTLNANVTDALPTANGRSAVIMDDTGTGNSSLSLVASQLIASLTGAADSLVSLLTGTYLTVGHSTGDATFTGVISGSGGLIKDRASTQTLTGANFYTGGTTLNGGTLKLSGALGALTATSAVNINGGTLLLSGLAANQISDTAPISLGAATDSMLQLSGAVTETLGAMTLAGGAGARVIDFGATSGVLTFASLSADSSLPLQIWNWSGTFRAGGGTDQLIVSNGTFGGSLAESDISFFTDSGVNRIAGTTGFTANNELVPVPEASTLLGVLGLLAPLAWRERRHWMRCREARG
jgi:autotransporter-associated beta strand protein